MNNTTYVDQTVLENAKQFNHLSNTLYIVQESKEIYFDAVNTEALSMLLEKVPNGKWKVPLVPLEAKDTLKVHGFTEYAFYQDYIARDLSLASHHEEIRECTVDDTSALLELTKLASNDSRGFSSFDEPFINEWLGDNKIFKYEENGEMVGYVFTAIYGDPKTVWLRQICTHPAVRGKGYGKKLIEEVFHYGKENGAVKSFLACDKENVSAIGLYNKYGYQCNSEDGELVMCRV